MYFYFSLNYTKHLRLDDRLCLSRGFSMETLDLATSKVDTEGGFIRTTAQSGFDSAIVRIHLKVGHYYLTETLFIGARDYRHRIAGGL